MGKKAHIERRPPQPGDVDRACADIALAREDLGYDPATKLADGLRRFIAWLRSAQA